MELRQGLPVIGSVARQSRDRQIRGRLTVAIRSLVAQFGASLKQQTRRARDQSLQPMQKRR